MMTIYVPAPDAWDAFAHCNTIENILARHNNDNIRNLAIIYTYYSVYWDLGLLLSNGRAGFLYNKAQYAYIRVSTQWSVACIDLLSIDSRHISYAHVIRLHSGWLNRAMTRMPMLVRTHTHMSINLMKWKGESCAERHMCVFVFSAHYACVWHY